MSTATMAAKDRELVISRLLNAPIELVWEVWTNPDHIKQWWGPTGFSDSINKMEVKPGGVWEHVMHGPDGTRYKNKSVFKEIVKHKKIVFDHVSAPKFTTTITFTARGNKTDLHWQMLFESAEQLKRVVEVFKAGEGLKQNIIKLESYLEKGYATDELILTREIKAPIDLVFTAWTNKDTLAKWWGPNGFSNPVCELDATPGGKIYIDMKGPDGTVYPTNGEVLEISAPRKFVFIHAPLDKINQRLFEVLHTVSLTEENEITKLNLQVKVSKINPDGKQYIAGITEGWGQSLDRFANLVE